MDRGEMIRSLSSASEEYDFIIIGGGATGIGILTEAVSRGYRAILLESSDFTKSTSSKSTKLVHGGVRYLAQGNIGLVREASVERGRLIRNAPHLVRNLKFIIPAYGLWDQLLYTTGLKFYDLLAGRYSLGPSLPVSGKRVKEEFPTLKSKGLSGGILYHDGQFDDSRLAVSLLKTACSLGGTALNYMPVESLIKNSGGRLNGVVARDLESGITYRLNGKFIVNATGVFADNIMEMDHEHHQVSIRPSQGVHLVIDRKFFPGEHALMIPKTADGRVLFAVPWHNRVILGTTDTPVDKISDEPVALEKEIDFILSTAATCLEPSPTRRDILSIFAGLRPLAAPVEGKTKTREISRSHKIIISESGLLTIVGGKWTTYRKMAEDLVNRAEKKAGLQLTASKTRQLKIKGFSENTDFSDPVYYYGSESELVRESLQGKPDEVISASLDIRKSQVLFAVREEMARNPEDFLARRNRALLLDARESIAVCAKVAEIMAVELGKDKTWIQEETEKYTRLAKNYFLES